MIRLPEVGRDYDCILRAKKLSPHQYIIQEKGSFALVSKGQYVSWITMSTQDITALPERHELAKLFYSIEWF